MRFFPETRTFVQQVLFGCVPVIGSDDTFGVVQNLGVVGTEF